MRREPMLAAALTLLLAACGGGGGDAPAPTAPDLAGVWAGSWQGSDPVLGPVSGTWEVAITQGAASAEGPTLLLGDVDCMAGTMSTAPQAGQPITGTLTRPPCSVNTWELTALNVDGGSASGAWGQPGSGASGTLSGTRIARLGGPRILFVSPPAGRAGSWVTLRTENAATLSASEALRFGNALQTTLQQPEPGRIVAQVPPGASAGAIRLTTADGSVASSPVPFAIAVGAPAAIAPVSIALPAAPTGVAVSPDGRKVYAAQRSSATGGVVSVVHGELGRVLASTDVAGGALRSIVANPDGRRIHVAASGLGVLTLDAAVASRLQTVAMDVGDDATPNPQGLAVSPDGALLAVSDARSGGAVTVLRSADLGVVATLALPPGSGGFGVAFAPDGSRLVVAAARIVDPGVDELRHHDPRSGALLARQALPAPPLALAFSPDGLHVFATHTAAHSVSRVDVATGALVQNVVGPAPTAIAHAPDGSRVLVADRDDGSVRFLDAASGAPAGPGVVAGGSMRALALTPAGTLGWAADFAGARIVQLGATLGLTVARNGTGIGRVESSPAGIDCGTGCQARFAPGTVVTLSASADRTAMFAGWSGDSDCADGRVTMNTTLRCIATFTSVAALPKMPAAGFGCFIATAAYGSDMAPQVQALRDFRDRRLMTNAPGRALVDLYHHVSPPLAERIARDESLRLVARVLLWPVVIAVTRPAEAATGLVLAALLAFGMLRQPRARDDDAPPAD